MIDTLTVAPATEVSLVLYERPPAKPPMPKTEQVGTTATAVIPAKHEAMAPSLSSQAAPAKHRPEAVEPSTASRIPAGGQGSGAHGPGTNPDTTAFFQIATQGKAIVYVIDRSGSMGSDGCLATAKRELLESLERLPSSVRFQIIAYNRSAEPLRINGQSGLTLATAENKQCVARLLEGLHAEGGTDHVAALKRALALGPDVIFFLTDADDLRVEEIRKIALLNHGRSVIHAIGLGRAGGVLHALARENHGLHQSVPLDR